MSQEHIAWLRPQFERFANGDFGDYSDFSDDFELVLAHEMPDAGSYRGEAARQWMRSWVESFHRLTIEAIEFIDAGEDQVVVEMLQRGSLAGSDEVVETQTWAVDTFREGALVRVELFQAREEALKAAGLSE